MSCISLDEAVLITRGMGTNKGRLQAKGMRFATEPRRQTTSRFGRPTGVMPIHTALREPRADASRVAHLHTPMRRCFIAKELRPVTLQGAIFSDGGAALSRSAVNHQPRTRRNALEINQRQACWVCCCAAMASSLSVKVFGEVLFASLVLEDDAKKTFKRWPSAKSAPSARMNAKPSARRSP